LILPVTEETPIPTEPEEEYNTPEPVEEPFVVESDEEEDNNRMLPNLIDVEFVEATTNVNVRPEPNTDCEVYFTLNHGNSLRYVGTYDEDWYIVEYDGGEAYVSRQYSQVVTKKALPYSIQCYGCLKCDATLFDSEGNPIREIPINELVEIYGEDEDYYLVGVYGYYGYMDKKLITKLSGTFVVTDKSDQATTVYVGGYPSHIYPVITADAETTEGLHAVNKIMYDTSLVDRKAGYDCPVDVFIRYYKGQGFHDAEHHTCKNGRHGWRSTGSFGGNT